MSYPHGDEKRCKSKEAACRPVPKKLVDQGEFTFCKVATKEPDWGLCRYGCAEGEECRNSWLTDDEDTWDGYSSMFRCMPKPE